MDRFGLGRKVLPILEALHDVISFLIVSMFFAATSMQVSYALTVSKVSTIFFNTYRMSFVGDMNSELFFGEEGLNWSLAGLFHFWWYFFFSFLVMVSLANIFIQVMGKAYDQAQDQFNSIQDQLEERRKKADKMYKELVKRGKKVEKDAKGAIDDIDLPKLELDSLTDRKKLEKQLDKAKARFDELKNSVSFKSAA